MQNRNASNEVEDHTGSDAAPGTPLGMHILGIKMPSPAELQTARRILKGAPTPARHPIQVALWFLSLRRAQISRTGEGHGAAVPGNPLLIALFDEACPGERTEPGDETPWCAAFVKWCALRSGQSLDITASSQSIARSKVLQIIQGEPTLGDLVQFVDVTDGRDMNSGHTGFYVATLPSEPKSPMRILLLGGNQNDAEGAWSIVSVAPHDVHFQEEPKIKRRLVGYFRDLRWDLSVVSKYFDS